MWGGGNAHPPPRPPAHPATGRGRRGAEGAEGRKGVRGPGIVRGGSKPLPPPPLRLASATHTAGQRLDRVGMRAQFAAGVGHTSARNVASGLGRRGIARLPPLRCRKFMSSCSSGTLSVHFLGFDSCPNGRQSIIEPASPSTGGCIGRQGVSRGGRPDADAWKSVRPSRRRR